MRILVFTLLLFVVVIPSSAQTFAPPDVPAIAADAAFPLRVHIFGVHWNYVRGYFEGYGRGDLLGDKAAGFDYTFSCGEPFLHNAQREEFYQARWKKQDQKLEILMQKVGSDRLHRCELKVALKPETYGRYRVRQTGAPAQ